MIAALAFGAAIACTAPCRPQASPDGDRQRPWLSDEPVRLVVSHAGDLDLPRSLAAWAERQEELVRISGKWATEPAPLPWGELAVSLIVRFQQNPLRAARVLALLHAAVDDAAAAQGRVLAASPAIDVAVHAAASGVLAYLYPNEAPGRLESIGRMAAAAAALRQPDSAAGLEAAWRLGQEVATRAVGRAIADGADALPDSPARSLPGPGGWRPAPPLNLARPSEPLAGRWRTWVLWSGAEVQPPPPVPYGTAAYWDEAEQVLTVSRGLTAEQKRIADDWHLDRGSVTPAGVWNEWTRRIVKEHRLGTADAARVLAVVHAAMADAFIACWHAKFWYRTQRPVNAIRERLDAAFLPYLITPPFPSYVSGHASVSGAAAEVLSAYFPSQRTLLSEAAAQAAQSRLYGGIHFQSDNDEGLELGRAVGRLVVQRLGVAELRAR